MNNIESGDRYEDSIFENTYVVKYADDEIVLLYDGDDETHHIYNREDFNVASEISLIQTENRFKKIDDNDN